MRILCIDDDHAFLTHIFLQLKHHADEIDTALTLKDAFKVLNQREVDLVFLDIGFSGNEDGLEGLKLIKKCYPDTQVVMLSGRKDPQSIMEATKNGAFDYLCKPFIKEQAIAIIEKVRQFSCIKEHNEALITNLNEKGDEKVILGKSPVFTDLINQVNKIKGYNANILIEGDSGTGKELVARLIHKNEGNTNRPFIAVNCAAIPEQLLESELFGYERGAFTGAHKRKIGKFQLAHGGDIFLDEISLLRPDLQAKILRVLQEKEISRVGGNMPIKVNFRVIAATNKGLDEMVKNGEFRLDLLHRLRIVHLQVPSLIERRDDIPVLASYFLEKYNGKGSPKTISPTSMAILKNYSWPGNVRELENVIHSSTIMSSTNEIEPSNLPTWLHQEDSAATSSTLTTAPCYNEMGQLLSLKEYQYNVERAYIKTVLSETQNDKEKAAKLMQIGKSTLYVKLKELNL